MLNNADLAGKMAFDANGLNNLKQAARENSPEAIKAVAQQFEAVFMNMMLKSMRAASPEDSPFDNEQSRTFTAMLDQQLSTDLAKKGMGLSEVLVRQLSHGGSANSWQQAVSDDEPIAIRPVNIKNPYDHGLNVPGMGGNPAIANPANTKLMPLKPLSENAAEFQQRMGAHAAAASRATGVPAHLMLGQAALESGWGKRELKAADGSASHNLFGIKAGERWSGKVVEAATSEYVNGVKQNRIEKFRAYDDYADSFKDFANMLRTSPRYEHVMANLNNGNNYAQAMQQAGYATDPNYASKLASVIQKLSPS